MQGRQLLYVRELYLVTSLLSIKACSFFLYIMKSLYFAGGFLVLTGRFVGVGGCSCILSGCVCCECCVIVFLWGHCSVGMVMLAHPD